MGPARQPLQLPIVLVLGIIVLSLALIIWEISRAIPIAVAGQAYLLIIILLGFRHWPPMRRWLAGMPFLHRLALGLMLGGLIIGHFTLSTRKYFPFVAWEIFARMSDEDPVACREFIATTSSGKQVRLLVEQLFPSIVQFNPPDDNDDPAMADLARTLARAYDRAHAQDPVRRVDLMRIAVPLHPPLPVPRPFPSCELLKSYDLSSARSN